MRLYFIDPMSYRNMADYDYGILSSPLFSKLDVKFFCNYLFNKEFNVNNVLIKKIFRYSKINNNYLKFLSYFFSWFKIFLSCCTARPDVIHIQWLRAPYFDFFVIFLLRRLLSIKVCLTAHNIFPHNSGDRYKTIYRLIYSEVDKIIVHANRTKNELMKELSLQEREKINIVPHGLIGSSSAYNVHNGSDDVITYLIIGGISKYKGIEEFVEAWKLVMSTGMTSLYPCELKIAGTGDVNYCISIHESVRDSNNIEFYCDELSDTDFQELIRNSNVLVCPYIKASQSGVLLTALSMEKLILVSEVGGLDEPLSISDVGWSFSWNRRDSLSEVISKSVLEYRKKQTNNKESWEIIRNFYGWDNIASKNIDIYMSLVKSS